MTTAAELERAQLEKATKEELLEIIEKIAEREKDINETSQARIADLAKIARLNAEQAGFLSDEATKRKEMAEAYRQFMKLQEAAIVDTEKFKTEQEIINEKIRLAGVEMGLVGDALKDFVEEAEKANEEIEHFNEQLKEGHKLGDEFFGGLAAKLGIGQSKLAEFTFGVLKLAKTDKGMDALRESFNKYFNRVNIGMSILTKVIEATIAYALAIDKATAAFAKNTGAGRIMSKEIAAVGSQFRNVGIDAEMAGKAAEKLFGRFPTFATQTRGVREELMATVAGLENLGVSADDSVESINFFSENLELSASRAAMLTREMALTGKALGKTATDITKDFNKSLKILAVYGDKAPKVFQNIAAQAAAATSSVDSLLSVAGKFDTFQDAAETTGKLNAILGTSLSTTEMMMATEDERIEILRRTFQAQGIAMKELDRFTQKAVAATIGIDDLNEAQRILGMSMGEYTSFRRKAEAADKSQKEFNKRMQEAMSIVRKLKMMMMEFAISLGPIIDSVAAIVQGFLNFMTMGNGIFLKIGLISTGVLLLSKFLFPLTGMVKLLGTLLFPKFAASIAATSTKLSAASPALGAAGAGLAAFGGGLAVILLPIAAVVASIGYLVSSLAELFKSLSIGAKGMKDMVLILPTLATLIGSVAGVGFFTAFGLGGVASGISKIGKAIKNIDKDSLLAMGEIFKAFNDESKESSRTFEAKIDKTSKLITDIGSNEKVKPVLENLALITTGHSAQTMSKSALSFDFDSPIDKLIKALDKMTGGGKEITLKLDANAVNALMAGRHYKIAADN